MKVLQIINSLMSGGAEKLVVDTTMLYHQEGIHVDVLILSSKEKSFYTELESQKAIETFSLNSKNVYHPFNVFKIMKIIKQYDVIHVHLFPSLYWTALANIFSSNKNKIIVTEHNSTNRRRNIAIFKAIDRFLYKQFKIIVTISAEVDRALKIHLGSAFNNFTKIHNGIKLKTFYDAEPISRDKLGYKNEDVLLLQVASFTPQKDQETLIRALKHLPPHYKLILIGKGPLENSLKNFVKDNNLQSRVNFMGTVSNVPNYLKSVDIVILSSNFEGLSLSSIEGMASGKPFVASEAPGLTEVVRDAGILFNIGDDKNLAKICQNLMSDSSFYKSTVRKCLKRSEDYAIENTVRQYVSLYKKLASS